jgi:hypothetical protein
VQHNSVDKQSGSFNLSPVDKAKAESLGLHSDLLEFLETDKELLFVQSNPSDAQFISLDKLSLELQCQDFGYQNAKEQRLIQEYREMASANFTYRNHSLDFDLVAAVHRQARFAEKMSQFNWLQSPTVASTLRYAIDRYGKFFFLIANFPGMTVPTLDVDLVWHTHQLSPARYMAFSKATANGRFIDHNDRVKEEELHTGFQQVQDLYREQFAEDYLLCHSWYCEAGRFDPNIALSNGDYAMLELLIERERERRGTLGLPVMMELAECECVCWQASNESGGRNRSPRPQASHCSRGGKGCSSGCNSKCSSCNSNCSSNCSGFCSGGCGGGC